MAAPKIEPKAPAFLKPAEPADIFTLYTVQLQFLTKLCASVPSDPNVIQKWIDSRKPKVMVPGGKSMDEIQEEVLHSINEGGLEPDTEYSKLVFQRHNGRVCVRADTLRAHIKELSRTLSAQYYGRMAGERAFSTRVVQGVYHDEAEYWIPVFRPDGSYVTEPDGSMDKAVHARGPRGEPINALKQFDYVDPPAAIQFQLKVLGNTVTQSDLESIFSLGATHGYAGERSAGEGRYRYAIEKQHEVQQPKKKTEVKKNGKGTK